MIYQIRTTKEMGLAKKYFKTREECKRFIKEVIASTERFRRGLQENPFPKQISSNELSSSVEMIAIDENKIPEWKILFGEEKEINHQLSIEMKEKDE